MVTYPREGLGAPKNRKGTATGDNGLPAGTKVFSADDHISLADDIFYERFPESMKDEAPRVVYDDGAWTLAVNGKGFLPREFTAVLMSYDPLDGSSTRDIHARLAELESDGIHAELAFPNALLGLMGWPDKAVRELCFRTYNEYVAELQEAVGRPLLRRRHHQLVGRRRHQADAGRSEVARHQDVLVAAQAGRRRRRQADRLQQPGDVRLLGSGRGERRAGRRITSAKRR